MRKTSRWAMWAATAAFLFLVPQAVVAQGACMTCEEDPNFPGTLWCADHGNPNLWGYCDSSGELCDNGRWESMNAMSIGQFAAIDVQAVEDVWTAVATQANVAYDEDAQRVVLSDCDGRTVATRMIPREVVAQYRLHANRGMQTGTSSL